MEDNALISESSQDFIEGSESSQVVLLRGNGVSQSGSGQSSSRAARVPIRAPLHLQKWYRALRVLFCVYCAYTAFIIVSFIVCVLEDYDTISVADQLFFLRGLLSLPASVMHATCCPPQLTWATVKPNSWCIICGLFQLFVRACGS